MLSVLPSRASNLSDPDGAPLAHPVDAAAMLYAAIGQSAVAILVCDTRFAPRLANPAAQTLFAIDQAQVSYSSGECWLWRTARIDPATVTAAIDRDGSWRGTHALSCPDVDRQRRVADIEISAFHDAGLAGFTIVARETIPQIPVDRRASDVDRIANAPSLTPREREVMQGLVEGLSNKSIGLRMAISPRTVEFHRARLMQRFGAKSLIDLIRSVLNTGL